MAVQQSVVGPTNDEKNLSPDCEKVRIHIREKRVRREQQQMWPAGSRYTLGSSDWVPQSLLQRFCVHNSSWVCTLGTDGLSLGSDER